MEGYLEDEDVWHAKKATHHGDHHMAADLYHKGTAHYPVTHVPSTHVPSTHITTHAPATHYPVSGVVHNMHGGHRLLEGN